MSAPKAPKAPKIPHETSHFGNERTDNYHWLRAENWREVMADPLVLDRQIRTHLEAENAWFETEFNEATKDLQARIYKEIRGRMKEDDVGLPVKDGPFAYFSRMETGKQYPVLMRTSRAGDDEKIILDCNEEAGEAYFGFGGAAHAPHHGLLAWAADRNGSEQFTIRFRDLATGKDLDDRIEGSAGGLAWSNDGQSIFYTMLDDNHRPDRVLCHRLGTPVASDRLVYSESDPGHFVSVGKTLSQRYIVISSGTHQTSEYHVIDADRPGEAPVCVAPRVTGREYDVDERDGIFYIRTNGQGAEDYKIVEVETGNSDATNWRDLIPHRPGTLIISCFVLLGHLVRMERENGLPRIVIRDLETGLEKTVQFDEEAYSLGVGAGYEFDTSEIRFTYSSPTTPSATYDYAVVTGKRELRKTQEIPSGHNRADYVTKRLYAPAEDGEQVPVTLLYRADLKPDARTPVHLYAYGAYGHSTPASFSISALSLVDRGFIYAIAHVRGGMEKGYSWYRKGKLADKPNSFTDFIAAADMLVAEGLTSKGRIVAEGASAGGMIMGAVANLAPDLFGAIVAQVPFVDVLNTMLDDTLPLTPPEWPEWGNPITSKNDYASIAAYSPYDNVDAQPYPPILAMAGLTDPRVTYWEPAKWVAKIRANRTNNAPLYLRTNMEAGHGGASGRFERIKEVATAYAFSIRMCNKDTR